MLEPSEIIEVKQGPYSGKVKSLFNPISDDKIKIKKINIINLFKKTFKIKVKMDLLQLIMQVMIKFDNF